MKASILKISIALLSIIILTATNNRSDKSWTANYEEAIFQITAYNHSGMALNHQSGFFISPDGLAIAHGSIFLESDSIVVTTSRGRRHIIEQLVSTHVPSNLVILKVRPLRSKSFFFLQPGNTTIKVTDELLIFDDTSTDKQTHWIGHPDKITDLPFLGRTANILRKSNEKMCVNPAINPKGEVAAICVSPSLTKGNLLYNPQILTDTNWVAINQPLSVIADTVEYQNYLSPDFNNGLIHLFNHNYKKSDDAFTTHLTRFKNHYPGYCLRGYVRFKYNNEQGGHDDLTHAKTIEPGGFLAYYLEGLIHLENKAYKKAQMSFIHCYQNKSDFAPALLELGRIELTINKDIKKSFHLFSEATDHDSLIAEAYYQKARLLLQYSEDQDQAFNDISRSIALEPELPGAFSIRGTLNLSRQNYSDAINDFTNAIQINSNDVHAFFNRGLAHLDLGMTEEACADWKRAGELGNKKAYKYISKYCTSTKTTGTTRSSYFPNK
ncbi:tetratricopeptide repeat protein [Marinilabiliaceae bacterium JC017]|nr:tetratricopeptide repeat protein [Marinilabiliaceae bacterium JC017]